MRRVQWKPANIFKPETYKQELKDAGNVVHSIGILLENQNYKSAVNNTDSHILSELKSLVSPPNPMKKNEFSSYDSVNRESAIILAKTLLEATGEATQTTTEPQPRQQKPSFTYISADRGFVGIPSGYINSKREAETELLKLNKLRVLIARPGFMFDQELNEDNFRNTLKNVLNVLNCGNHLIGDKFGNLIRPTISTQRVSQSLLKYIKDEKFRGVITLDDLLK